MELSSHNPAVPLAENHQDGMGFLQKIYPPFGTRKHIPPNGKFGKSSQQKCRLGGDMLVLWRISASLLVLWEISEGIPHLFTDPEFFGSTGEATTS